MQKQATFYTLADKNKFEFCSKLCTQLWRKSSEQTNPIIWILGDSVEAISILSELLWEQDKDSFIPHQTIKHSYLKGKIVAPICLTLASPLPTWQGILINFSSYPLIHFENTHIIEIITNDTKELAREHYKHYKANQFIMKHHNIHLTDNSKYAATN